MIAAGHCCTESRRNAVGRITLDGMVMEFSIAAGSLPGGITAGPVHLAKGIHDMADGGQHPRERHWSWMSLDPPTEVVAEAA